MAEPGFLQSFSQPGPFSDQLSKAAERPQQAGPSGWATAPAQVMYVAGQFLEGARRGKFERVAADESRKDKQWESVGRQIQAVQSDPNLTDEGRAAVAKAATTIAASRWANEAPKDVASGKPQGILGLVGHGLHSAFETMTGGDLKEFKSNPIDPGKAMLTVTDIAQDPRYSKSAAIDEARSKFLDAVHAVGSSDRYKDAPHDMTQQEVMEQFNPHYDTLARKVGHEEAANWLGNQLANYRVRGTDAEETMRPVDQAINRQVAASMSSALGGQAPPAATPAATPTMNIPPLLARPSDTPAPLLPTAFGGAPPPVQVPGAPAKPAEVPMIPSMGQIVQRRLDQKFGSNLGNTVSAHLKENPTEVVPVQMVIGDTDAQGNPIYVKAGTRTPIQNFGNQFTLAPERITQVTYNKGDKEFLVNYNPNTQKYMIDGKEVNPIQKGWKLGQADRPDQGLQRQIAVQRSYVSKLNDNYDKELRAVDSQFQSQDQAIVRNANMPPKEKAAARAKLKEDYTARQSQAWDNLDSQVKSSSLPLLKADEIKIRVKPRGYVSSAPPDGAFAVPAGAAKF